MYTLHGLENKYLGPPDTATQFPQSLSEDSLELEDDEDDDSSFLFFCFFFWCFPCSFLFFLLFFFWLFTFFFFLLLSSSDEEQERLRFFFFFVVSSLDEQDLFLDFLSLLFFRLCLPFLLSLSSSLEPLLRPSFSVRWAAGTSSSLSSLLVLLTSRTMSFWGSTLTKFRHSKVKWPGYPHFLHPALMLSLLGPGAAITFSTVKPKNWWLLKAQISTSLHSK